MYKLVIKPNAIGMAKEAYQWYEEQQTGLGDLFIDELESCYHRIEVWPASYAKIKKDFRQIILRTFPFVVVFKLLNEGVVVYAVFHTSRNPRRKFKK